MRNVNIDELALVTGGDESDTCDSVEDVAQGIAAGLAAYATRTNPIATVIAVPISSELGESLGSGTCDVMGTIYTSWTNSLGSGVVELFENANMWGDIGEP